MAHHYNDGLTPDEQEDISPRQQKLKQSAENHIAAGMAGQVWAISKEEEEKIRAAMAEQKVKKPCDKAERDRDILRRLGMEQERNRNNALNQGVTGMVGIDTFGNLPNATVSLQQQCDNSLPNGAASIYSQAARARENAQAANKESDRLSELVLLFEKNPDVKRILELLHITT